MRKTRWKRVHYNGKTYDLSHLHPFSFNVNFRERVVSIAVAFSSHCFTDQKESDAPMVGQRYFCLPRYALSKELPRIIRQQLVTGYAVPHYDRASNEVYYYAAIYDYDIFFDLRRSTHTPGGLNLFVLSAYERDGWGSVPEGKPKKFDFIGYLKLEGKSVLPKRKKR